MNTSTRLRALRQAFNVGKRMQAEYMHSRMERQRGTDREGYVSSSLLQLNKALLDFKPNDSTEVEYEQMLRSLWVSAVHGWASVPGPGYRWRLYVAGLIGESGEIF